MLRAATAVPLLLNGTSRTCCWRWPLCNVTNYIRLPVRCAHAGSSVQQVITSTSNNYLKHCIKLRTSNKYREEVGRFLLVDSELILEAAGCMQNFSVLVLFIAENAEAPHNIRYEHLVRVTEPVLKKLTGLENVYSVAAVAELEIPPAADFNKPGSAALSRLLVLDRVQDPGNMGTLLRTALALGWQGAYLLPGCCDPFNDKAVRASRGAVLRLPLCQGTLDDLDHLVKRHNLHMLAADLGGDSSSSSSGGGSSSTSASDRPGQPAAAIIGLGGRLPYSNVALVLGSEGQGLTQEVRARCTPVSIPMPGDMESLNVGTAGGILMFMMSEGLPPLLQRLSQLAPPDPPS